MIFYIILDIYKSININSSAFYLALSQSAFISALCLFWPFANTYDFFGQQQNGFLWYCISIYIVIARINCSYSKTK